MDVQVSVDREGELSKEWCGENNFVLFKRGLVRQGIIITYYNLFMWILVREERGSSSLIGIWLCRNGWSGYGGGSGFVRYSVLAIRFWCFKRTCDGVVDVGSASSVRHVKICPRWIMKMLP